MLHHWRAPLLSQEGTYTFIMYYVWWDYFNHFNTRANISQPHSSPSLTLIRGVTETDSSPPATAKILCTTKSACQQHDIHWGGKGEMDSCADTPALDSFHHFTVSVASTGETELLLKAFSLQGKNNQRLLLRVISFFLNMQISLLSPWALKCKYFSKGFLAFKIQNKGDSFLMCYM